MTLICLRGLSLTGFTAALGSLLRRRNYLGFNVLPITVLKFLTILPLCVLQVKFNGNRGSAEGWEPLSPCGPSLQGEKLLVILSAPLPLLNDLCPLPWQVSGHSSERLGRSTPLYTELGLRPSVCEGLEKEMATHSSVLAWRIPGTGAISGVTVSDTTEAT